MSSSRRRTAAVPFTVGIAFDLCRAVLFLHVFLAFPSGRLERLVRTGCSSARAMSRRSALQLVGMALGGFGPDNLLEVDDPARRGRHAARASSSSRSARVCLAGIGGPRRAPARRGPAAAPLARAAGRLVRARARDDRVLLLSRGSGSSAARPLRDDPARSPSSSSGSRRSRSWSGCSTPGWPARPSATCFLELRADPAPGDLRDALARALRDPSLAARVLAAGVRRAGPTSTAAPVELPEPDERRATTLIERDGAPVAALVHDPSLSDEPELLDAVSAAAGIALENARLQAELRARLEELRGSRARVIEAGQQRAAAAGAQPARRRAAAARSRCRSSCGLLEQRLGDDPDARARLEQARQEIATSLEELRDVARGLHPAVVSGHGLGGRARVARRARARAGRGST